MKCGRFESKSILIIILLVDHVTGDFDALNFQPFINRQVYLKLSLNRLRIKR